MTATPSDSPTPPPTALHECLHPELIDDVRQARKRRWPVFIALGTLVGGSLLGLATCVYTQGQAAGSSAVRIEQIGVRAAEDRGTIMELQERQRASDTDAIQRHTELLETLHGIDSRLGRIEDRVGQRRPVTRIP